VETIATTYAKAVDELSAKIFVPALICSLFVELGPTLQNYTGLNFWLTYLLVAFAGLIAAPLLLSLLIEISIRFFKGRGIGDVFGILIMPLGFAGLFPTHFVNIDVPFSAVTGVAILSWSFMLVQQSGFINNLREFF